MIKPIIEMIEWKRIMNRLDNNWCILEQEMGEELEREKD